MAGSGNSRTEQMQETAARTIILVVANKNANTCRRRKNGLPIHKYPCSLWPISHSAPHSTRQDIHCFREKIKTPSGCKECLQQPPPHPLQPRSKWTLSSRQLGLQRLLHCVSSVANVRSCWREGEFNISNYFLGNNLFLEML